MSQLISTDVLIVGGGVAGLWLNARLQQLGYATLLVESGSLGGGQTGKSQGIIHGGTKYALQGSLTGSSEAIADMPRRWRAALAGQGELDLQGVRLLSEAHYLWSPGTIAANLTSFFASKALRGRIDPVSGDERPVALRHERFKGTVYRLAEWVLDIPSLLACLARLSKQSLLAGTAIQPLLEGAELVGLQVDEWEIRAKRTVFCAGAGNAALLQCLGLQQPAMQIRPLHMVLLQAPTLEPLYAHCLGASVKPRLTVTSHPTPSGQLIWYLGGELAEAAGVARSTAAQIAYAQQELQALFPWLDLHQARWTTLRVDRAEPAQSGLVRPDNAFLSEQGRLLVGWPTKLALAPDFADRVIARLQQVGITPSSASAWPTLPQPALAPPFWEVLDAHLA